METSGCQRWWLENPRSCPEVHDKRLTTMFTTQQRVTLCHSCQSHRENPPLESGYPSTKGFCPPPLADLPSRKLASSESTRHQEAMSQSQVQQWDDGSWFPRQAARCTFPVTRSQMRMAGAVMVRVLLSQHDNMSILPLLCPNPKKRPHDTPHMDKKTLGLSSASDMPQHGDFKRPQTRAR